MDVNGPFEDQGLDSLLALEALAALAKRLGLPLCTDAGLRASHAGGAWPRTWPNNTRPKSPQRSRSNFITHPAALPVASGGVSPRGSFVRGVAARRTASRESVVPSGTIAVIGYALRLPGARNAAEYWNILREGRDCVSAVPAERCGWRESAPSTSSGCEGGFLEGVEQFDAGLFRILPAEAEALDPRQRLFLEVGYECLERAGYGGTRFSRHQDGRVRRSGEPGLPGGARAQGSSSAYWATSGSPSILASRLAYFLDLQGPCLPIDTACSSSLVAVHLAVESLRRGECTTAIAGGVHLNLWLSNFAAFREMGALGPRRPLPCVRRSGRWVRPLRGRRRRVAQTSRTGALLMATRSTA